MEKPIREIEFEIMLLGKHGLAASTARREGGLLDRSAYVLLSRLRMQGPMSIRQLSDAFGLDQSTLNRQTSAMLQAGLVDRIPDPEGGIARKFRITAQGERKLSSDRERIVGSLEKIMGDWTPADVEVFAAYLNRFNTDIERHTGRPWPRP